MLDIHVELFERILIEQQVDPLARRQLALAVLRGNPLFTTAETRRCPSLLQFRENLVHQSVHRFFMTKPRSPSTPWP